MLPLPTVLRAVSGRERMIRSKQNPETMERNQNIQRQPIVAPMTPPSMGPIVGAVVILGSQQVAKEAGYVMRAYLPKGQRGHIAAPFTGCRDISEDTICD